MDSIRNAFLNPKEGLADYSKQILESIASRSSFYNFTSDGVKVLTQTPLDFSPLTNIGERASIILNEEIGIKARSSIRTTDILSITAGYNNLHTIYDTILKAPGRSISIESISQQNPIRGISFLTSDHSICSDPPVYPEGVVLFLQSLIPVVASFKDEDAQKDHILHILDLGVGNGEILASACATPRIIYTGVDSRLTERFVEATTEDAPIHKDSRGIIDIFTMTDPQIVRRCSLVPEMPVKEEITEKLDIVFIHVDYYTATKGDIKPFIPILNDTGLIIIYGNPFMESIWRDLCYLGNTDGGSGFGFWGMIGIQNIQKTVTPFMILSKNGVLFDPYMMDISLFKGGIYGEHMISYRPSGPSGEDKIRVELIEYRKKKIPQVVGNLYKNIKISVKENNIAHIDAIDNNLEKYLDLFQTTSESSSSSTNTAIRIFSYQSGNPVERIITTNTNPNIRIQFTRLPDYISAHDEYLKYIETYKAIGTPEFKARISIHPIFTDLRKILEKSIQNKPGEKSDITAVIIYHRDNFVTELLTSFLSKMKVKVGILINPQSELGVVSILSLQSLVELYPNGVSFFHRIQDAFSTFDDKIRMIINLSVSTSPDDFIFPSDTEKNHELQRSFKLKETSTPPVYEPDNRVVDKRDEQPLLNQIVNIADEGGAGAMT